DLADWLEGGCGHAGCHCRGRRWLRRARVDCAASEYLTGEHSLARRGAQTRVCWPDGARCPRDGLCDLRSGHRRVAALCGLLGFAEQSSGKAETSAWSALQHGDYLVLLTSTQPPLDIPRLPLLFYFYFDDVDSAIEALRSADVEVLHMGHPPHALG